MKDIVSQFAMQLTLAEKRELVAELKGAIAEELASRASGPADPDLCQVFGHGSSRSYAAMGSPSSACLVRSKNESMARAGTW